MTPETRAEVVDILDGIAADMRRAVTGLNSLQELLGCGQDRQEPRAP
jgi:hypothetical protein